MSREVDRIISLSYIKRIQPSYVNVSKFIQGIMIEVNSFHIFMSVCIITAVWLLMHAFVDFSCLLFYDHQNFEIKFKA